MEKAGNFEIKKQEESCLFVVHHSPIDKRKHEIIGSREESNHDLSSYGEKEAVIRAEEFQKILGKTAIESIITSNLNRSIDSAYQIYDKLEDQIPTVIIDPDSTAQNFGEMEGKTMEELELDPKLKNCLWHNINPEKLNDDKTHGGESITEFTNRINQTFDQYLEENKNSLVVTHGSVIDVLIAKRLNMNRAEVAGWNRAFEGRIIKLTQDNFEAIGKPMDYFEIHFSELKTINNFEEKIELSKKLISELDNKNQKIHLGQILEKIEEVYQKCPEILQ